MSKTTLHSTYPQRTSLRLNLCLFVLTTRNWPRLGFALALRLVLRIRVGGLLSLGPPCGSFTWINLFTHKRNPSQPFGDQTLPHILNGNLPLCIKSDHLCFFEFDCLLILGLFRLLYIYGPTCTSKVDGACMFIMLDCHSARSFFCSWTTIQFVCSVLPTSEENHQGYQWVYHSLPFQMLLATRFQCSNVQSIMSAVWYIHFDRVLDWTDLDLGQYVLSALSLSWMGSYGHSSAKPSAVWGSMPCPRF